MALRKSQRPKYLNCTLISSFFFDSICCKALNLSACAFAMYSVSADGSRKRGVDALRILCDPCCAINACVLEASRAAETAIREIFIFIVVTLVNYLCLVLKMDWMDVLR